MLKDTNPKDNIGSGKWRQFGTMPVRVLWEVAVGMMEGGLKYGRHNYRAAGVRATVYTDASIGHITQWIEGEDKDPDTGLSHITKAICSLMVLRDGMLEDNFVDDRPYRHKGLDAHRDELQQIVDNMIEKHAVTQNPYIETERENGASANPAQPVAAESQWESPVIFDGMAENSDVQQSRYMREF
jgi:hypothetical protein